MAKHNLQIPYRTHSAETGRLRTHITKPQRVRRIPSTPITQKPSDQLEEPSAEYEHETDSHWNDVGVINQDGPTYWEKRQSKIDRHWDELRPKLLEYILAKNDAQLLCECPEESRKINSIIVVNYRGLFPTVGSNGD
jgi:hypothetical protein